MKFKKIISFFFASSLLLTSCNSYKGSFTFHYSQSTTSDYSGSAFYSDDYFSTDSTDFNNSLATTSLCFAMSSFASNTNNSDYSYRYNNAKEFLKHNGFVDFDVNDYYKVKPTKDSLGAVFAHKTINGVTLVAAGVRGGNYEMEWASNFTLGDGKTIKQHQGFYEASTIYLESLENYLKKYNISGSIKLWTVGYSRGGATNNIACGRIDQKINNNEKIFNNVDVTIKKEDLYSYCFEPPQGASFTEDISPRDDIYSNIHNIVNANDPVPKVAMSTFRFTRYGVDYYLPDSVRNTNISEFNKKMLSYYNKVDNRLQLGDYIITDFDMRKGKEEALDALERSYVRKNWTSGLFLEELLDQLSLVGVGTLDYYVNNIQTGIRNICEIVYNHGGAKFSFLNFGTSIAKTLINYSNIDNVINNLIHDQDAFVNDLLHVLKLTFDSLQVEIDSKKLVCGFKNLLGAFAKTLLSHIEYFFAFLSTDNIKAIAEGHYPEVCLANLMALDKNYTSKPIEYNTDGSYYYLSVPKISEETKITISDKNGNVVAGLENGTLLEDGTLTYASLSKTFVCYIPVEAEYTICVENADSCDLSYFDQKSEYLIVKEEKKLDDTKKVEFKTSTYPEK